MRARNIDVVLDVGANTGQYVDWLRASGYAGAIVSFEPMPSAFDLLTRRYAHDPLWRGFQVALGSEPGAASFNVVPGSHVLSSMLRPTDRLAAVIPQAAQTQQIQVDVVALRDLWDDIVQPGSRTMLKIDTQGYEHQVLDGAEGLLDRLALLEVEMSLVELYAGGSSLDSLLPRVREMGLQVVSIESDGGFIDEATGQVLDVNVLAGVPL